MKQNTLLTIAVIVAFTAMNNLFAQQGNVAAGGEAAGTGGSMSYSIGQVDYLVYTSPQGSLSLGLQQSWFTVPLVLEIPETIITEGQSLCFNATETVIVAGNGKHFTVESGAHADVIAGQKILMKEGTAVESGGSLHAYISDIYCNQPENLLTASEAEQVITEPIFENELKNGFFKVYPNPTTGNFTLELLKVEAASLLFVEIFTMQGNLVLSQEMPAQQQYNFSLSEKNPGFYLIRVQSREETGIAKIIKQ